MFWCGWCGWAKWDIVVVVSVKVRKGTGTVKQTDDTWFLPIWGHWMRLNKDGNDGWAKEGTHTRKEEKEEENRWCASVWERRKRMNWIELKLKSTQIQKRKEREKDKKHGWQKKFNDDWIPKRTIQFYPIQSLLLLNARWVQIIMWTLPAMIRHPVGERYKEGDSSSFGLSCFSCSFLLHLFLLSLLTITPSRTRTIFNSTVELHFSLLLFFPSLSFSFLFSLSLSTFLDSPSTLIILTPQPSQRHSCTSSSSCKTFFPLNSKFFNTLCPPSYRLHHSYLLSLTLFFFTHLDGPQQTPSFTLLLLPHIT